MKINSLVVTSIFLLSGCGGGSGDNNPFGNTGVNGKYFGSYTNHDVTTVIYQGKTFYTMYSAKDRKLALGFDQGALSAHDGSFNGMGTRFFALNPPEGMTVSGTYWPGLLTQKVAPTTGPEQLTLPSVKAFDVAPSLKAIAGTMEGTVIGSSTAQRSMVAPGTLTITQDGKVTGESGTCKYSGDVKPLALTGTTVTKGNLFDITLRFPAGDTCPFANREMSGILLPRSDNPNKSDVMVKGDAPSIGLMFYSAR